jgi:hypothetical protein
MAWEVEYTDEFEQWWKPLSEEERISLDASVRLLEARGYETNVPVADRLYDEHLEQLRKEGLLNG